RGEGVRRFGEAFGFRVLARRLGIVPGETGESCPGGRGPRAGFGRRAGRVDDLEGRLRFPQAGFQVIGAAGGGPAAARGGDVVLDPGRVGGGRVLFLGGGSHGGLGGGDLLPRFIETPVGG